MYLTKTKGHRRRSVYGAMPLILFCLTVRCTFLGLVQQENDDSLLLVAAATVLGTAGTGGSPSGTGDGTPANPCANLVGGSQAIALSLSGTSSVLAGAPSGDTSNGDLDGTGTAVRFDTPAAITSDGTYLYVLDADNNKIRRIDPNTGATEVFAGPPAGNNTTGDTDGVGTAARFNAPSGITCDCANLYVADSSNHKIRKIVIATRQVTTLAGPAQGSTIGGDVDDIAHDARFGTLGPIATDGINLYVGQGSKVRRIVIATGAVTSIIGPAAGASANGDVDANGNNARFGGTITGLSVAGGNLYAVDRANQKIRKVNLTTLDVTVFAGPPQGNTTAGDVDAVGTAARFFRTTGIASDGTNLYVSEGNGLGTGDQIRKIVIATRSVTTLLGDVSGDLDGTGTAARITTPRGMTALNGILYFGANHKVRKVN